MGEFSDPYGLYRPPPRAPLNPAEVERMVREMRTRVTERVAMEDAQFYTSLQTSGALQQEQQGQLQQMQGQALEQQTAQLQMDMMLQDTRIPEIRSGIDKRIQELSSNAMIPQEQRGSAVVDLARTLGEQGAFRQGLEEDVQFGRQKLKEILEGEAGLTGVSDAMRSGIKSGFEWDSAESSGDRVLRLLKEAIQGQVMGRVGGEIGYPGLPWEPNPMAPDFGTAIKGLQERVGPEKTRLFGRAYEPEPYAEAVYSSVLRQAQEEGIEVPESTIKDLAGGAGTLIGLAPTLLPIRGAGQAVGRGVQKLLLPKAGKLVQGLFSGMGAFGATTGAVAARGPNTAQQQVIASMPEDQRDAASMAAGLYNGLTFGFFMPAWGVGAALGRRIGARLGGRLVSGVGALAGEAAAFPIAAGTSQIGLEALRDVVAETTEGVDPKALNSVQQMALLSYQTNPVMQDAMHKLLQSRSLPDFVEAAKTYAGEVGQGMVAFGVLKLLRVRPDLTKPTDRASAQEINATIEAAKELAKAEVGEFVADAKLEGEEAQRVAKALEAMIDGDAEAVRVEVPEGSPMERLTELKGEEAERIVSEEALVERVLGKQEATRPAEGEVAAEPAPRTVEEAQAKLTEQKKEAEVAIATEASGEAVAKRDEVVARKEALTLLQEAEKAKGTKRTKLLLQAEERLAEAEQAAGREVEPSKARQLVEQARAAKGPKRLALVEQAREALAAAEVGRATEARERAAEVALGEPAKEAERRKAEIAEGNEAIKAGKPAPKKGQKVKLSGEVKGKVVERPSDATVAVQPEPQGTEPGQDVASAPTVVAPVSATKQVVEAAPAPATKPVPGRTSDVRPSVQNTVRDRALTLADAFVREAQEAQAVREPEAATAPAKKKGGRPKGKTVKFSDMVVRDREQNAPDLPDHSTSSPEAEAIRNEMTQAEAKIAEELGKQLKLPYATHSLAKHALEAGVPLHEGELAEGVQPDASHPRYAEGVMNPGSQPRAIWNVANLETAYASVAKFLGRNGKVEKALKDLIANGDPEAMFNLADELKTSTDPAVRSLGDSIRRNIDMVTGKGWAPNRMAAELGYRWLVDVTGQAKPETSLGEIVSEFRQRVKEAREAFLASNKTPDPQPAILLEALERMRGELNGPMGTALRGYDAGRKLLAEIKSAQALPSQVGTLSIGDILDAAARGYQRIEAWNAGRVMSKSVLPHNEQFVREPKRMQSTSDKALDYLGFETPRNHMGKVGEESHQAASRAEQDAAGVIRSWVRNLDEHGIKDDVSFVQFTKWLEADDATRAQAPKNIQEAGQKAETILKQIRRMILRNDKHVFEANQEITRLHRRARFLLEDAKKLQQQGNTKLAADYIKRAKSLTDAADGRSAEITEYIKNWGRERYASAQRREDIDKIRSRIADLIGRSRDITKQAKGEGRPMTKGERKIIDKSLSKISKLRKLLHRARTGERVKSMELWFAAPHLGRWERWARDNMVSFADKSVEAQLHGDPSNMGTLRSRYQRKRLDLIPEREREMDPRKWFSRYARSVIPMTRVNEFMFNRDAYFNGEHRPVGFKEMVRGDDTRQRIYIYDRKQWRLLGKVWVMKDGSVQKAGMGEAPEGAKERVALWSIAAMDKPMWRGIDKGDYAKSLLRNGTLRLETPWKLTGNLERRYGGLLAEIAEAGEQTISAARRQQWDRLFVKLGTVLEKTNMTHVEAKFRRTMRIIGRNLGTWNLGLLSAPAGANILMYGSVQNYSMLGAHAFARSLWDTGRLMLRMGSRWKHHRASIPMEGLDQPLYQDWAGQTSLVREYSRKLRTEKEGSFEAELMNDASEDIMSMPVMTHRVHRMWKVMDGSRTWFGKIRDTADAISWSFISAADWVNRAQLSMGLYRQAYTHARFNLDMSRQEARHYAQMHTQMGVTSEHGNYVDTASSRFDDSAVAPVVGVLERWTRNYLGVLLRAGPRYMTRYMATMMAATYLLREMGIGDLTAGLGMPWRNFPLGGEEIDTKMRQLAPQENIQITENLSVPREALPGIAYVPLPVPMFSNPGTEPVADTAIAAGKLLSGNWEGFKRDMNRTLSNLLVPRSAREWIKAFGTEEVAVGGEKKYRYTPYRLFGENDTTSVYYNTRGLDMMMQQTLPGAMLDEADQYNRAATERALSKKREGERAGLRADTQDFAKDFYSEDPDAKARARARFPELVKQYQELGVSGFESPSAARQTLERARGAVAVRKDLTVHGRAILHSTDKVAQVDALTRGLREKTLNEMDLQALLMNPLTRINGKTPIQTWIRDVGPERAVEFLKALRSYREK